MTYWHVGKQINQEVLHGERAAYGKEIVGTVARQLVLLYGKSFELRNLRRMMQFADLFPDIEIVSPPKIVTVKPGRFLYITGVCREA